MSKNMVSQKLTGDAGCTTLRNSNATSSRKKWWIVPALITLDLCGIMAVLILNGVL